MANLKLRKLGLGSAIMAITSALLLSAPSALADRAPVITVQEQAQAAIMAQKVLKVIRAMSSQSSQTAFEGVILGVTSGKPCVVVRAAITIVAASPGLPPAAVAAANQVAKACGPIGALGPNPNLIGGPGFAPGGGGSNYSP